MRKYFYIPLLVAVLSVGYGCSRSVTKISTLYRLETKNWGIGDSGWNCSLWGLAERNNWSKLWYSLPLCKEAESWVLVDGSLFFIGWSKTPKDVGDRRLLVTKDAAIPIDITDQTIAHALSEGILPPNAKFREDFMFDGVQRSENGIFVVALALTKNAGFTIVRLPIKRP